VATESLDPMGDPLVALCHLLRPYPQARRDARRLIRRPRGYLARVLRTASHVKASLTAAIVVRSLWAAERSTGAVQLLVVAG
jgi:hypothetical protein